VWGLRPHAPGIWRFNANPRVMFAAGAQFSTGPSLVLAPESALRLRTRRALSSAPAVCSVFTIAIICNHGTEKTRNRKNT